MIPGVRYLICVYGVPPFVAETDVTFRVDRGPPQRGQLRAAPILQAVHGAGTAEEAAKLAHVHAMGAGPPVVRVYYVSEGGQLSRVES